MNRTPRPCPAQTEAEVPVATWRITVQLLSLLSTSAPMRKKRDFSVRLHVNFALEVKLISLLLSHFYEKREEIWLSLMTKTPTSSEMSKGKVTTQTTPHKSSITQRLRTDLGRSVGVTTATQLVWLTGLWAQHSHSLQQPCNQKDTHLKICK